MARRARHHLPADSAPTPEDWAALREANRAARRLPPQVPRGPMPEEDMEEDRRRWAAAYVL